MFCGHAPPFGWYCSASRSRASAPSSSAICVTSPVAPGWFVDSSPRSSASRKQRPPAARTTVAGVDLVLAAARAPAVLARLERARAGTSGTPSRMPSLERVAQRLRDRVAGAVADLEQPLARRAAAAREAVAAVLARELDAELLEPVDRGRRLRREHLDEPAVGRLVGRVPDVLGVLLGRVVLAERGLDAALRLGRVARLERSLRRQRDAGARALGGDGGGEAGGAAADHEHVERTRARPRPADPT